MPNDPRLKGKDPSTSELVPTTYDGHDEDRRRGDRGGVPRVNIVSSPRRRPGPRSLGGVEDLPFGKQVRPPPKDLDSGLRRNDGAETRETS